MTQVQIEQSAEMTAGRSVVSAASSLPSRSNSQPTSRSAAPAASGSKSPGLNDLQRRLLEILRNQPEPLFALLDAARDACVLETLRRSGQQYESLYEGKQGEELASYAPYLVELPKDSPFLITLLAEGWSKSWGVFLSCNKPLDEVRRHFRHFLLVETEDGKQLYFRFYDPRVLREFLPAFNKSEATEFFGPIRYYILEGATPDLLLRYGLGEEGVREEKTKVLDSVSTA